jgi:hypothetical protein
MSHRASVESARHGTDPQAVVSRAITAMRFELTATGPAGCRARKPQHISRHDEAASNHLLLGGLMLVPFMLLTAYAILSRIDQGFAVFG